MLYTVIFCYTHTYTLLTFRFHITPPHSSNAFAVDGEKTSNHHFFAENTCQSWWIYSRQLGHRWKHSSKECAFATWPCWDVFFAPCYPWPMEVHRYGRPGGFLRLSPKSRVSILLYYMIWYYIYTQYIYNDIYILKWSIFGWFQDFIWFHHVFSGQ